MNDQPDSRTLPDHGMLTGAGEETPPIHAQDGILLVSFVDTGTVEVRMNANNRDWLIDTITQDTFTEAFKIGIEVYGYPVFLRCIEPGGGVHYNIIA